CWATMLVATSGIACQDNGLGPSAHVRVTMTMQEIALPPAVALARPQIVVKGDSVVTGTVIFTSGCYHYAASGQAPIGQLTLTIVETEATSDCTPAGLVEGLSVVAHGLPAGFRYARLIDRV